MLRWFSLSAFSIWVALSFASPLAAQAQDDSATDGNAVIGEIGGGQCKPRPLRDYAEKMVGGDVTTADLWPGIVTLGAAASDESRAFYNCGGVLLNARTVLTAAHCLNNSVQDPDTGAWSYKFGSGAQWPMVVAANIDDLAADEASITARVTGGETIAEDDRTYRTDFLNRQYNDIAILTLDRDLPGPYARLSGSLSADPAIEGHLLWAAGFGTTDADNSNLNTFNSRRGDARTSAPAQVLSDAILQFKPQNVCAPPNGGVISDTMHICAGWDEGGHDSCQGDSGGPLAVLDGDGCPVVVGLTSYGNGCGVAGSYGIYTRVSQYRDWIESKTDTVTFTEASPPAAGQEAFKRMVDAVLEAGAGSSDLIETTFVQNGAPVSGPLKAGQAYELRISASFEGKVMIVDKTESGFYDLIFPFMEDNDESIGPGREVVLPLFAQINDRDADTELGSVNIFVLPPSVNIRDVFLAPAKTGTKSLRLMSAQSGVQLSDEFGRISELLALGSEDDPASQLASKALEYRINR